MIENDYLCDDWEIEEVEVEEEEKPNIYLNDIPIGGREHTRAMMKDEEEEGKVQDKINSIFNIA